MKPYTGSVYIGVVGGDHEIGVCRDSIHGLQLQPGDAFPRWIRATKGYEARQMHLNKWYEAGKHEFILFLDHDMIFPPDTLEKLRSHRLPFVSGYYLRRQYSPIAPVWLHPHRNGWPFIPFTSDPDPNVLHDLGGSGWGCLLLHRDVVTAVKEVLKGEHEIIEDDMDIWPYHLPYVMNALKGLREIVSTQPPPRILYPALDANLKVLEREIRPLRAVKDPVGSDIRFPFYARHVGFKLYGDASVRCGHALDYPLHPDDFSGTPEESRLDLEKRVTRDVAKERQRVKRALGGLK